MQSKITRLKNHKNDLLPKAKLQERQRMVGIKFLYFQTVLFCLLKSILISTFTYTPFLSVSILVFSSILYTYNLSSCLLDLDILGNILFCLDEHCSVRRCFVRLIRHRGSLVLFLIYFIYDYMVEPVRTRNAIIAFLRLLSIHTNYGKNLKKTLNLIQKFRIRQKLIQKKIVQFRELLIAQK